MKTAAKIVLAGIAGTSLMTLYSYYSSKKAGQQYVEPRLLNRLIDHSTTLPVKVHDNHAAGWLLHYAVGTGFVTAYYIFWKKALHEPDPAKMLVVGAVSGIAAIGMWKLLFAANNNPPHNDRSGYYGQLFIAHLIFSGTALAAYKGIDHKTL